MKTIALGGSAMLAPAAAAARTPAPAPLIHHVFFWLARPGSVEDRDRLVAALKGLAAIGQIQMLHVGVPAATEARGVVDSSYDVSELMMFDSLEDQAAYQVHPLHQAFVETNQQLWRKVVVYDSVPA